MSKKVTVGSLDKPVSPAAQLANEVQKKPKVNRSTKKAETVLKSQSQHANKDKHRTILIKSETDQDLKALATIYGTSVNELINRALDGYVGKQLEDANLKKKFDLPQQITIKK